MRKKLYFLLLLRCFAKKGRLTGRNRHRNDTATGDDRREVKGGRKEGDSTANSTSKCFWNHFQMCLMSLEKAAPTHFKGLNSTTLYVFIYIIRKSLKSLQRSALTKQVGPTTRAGPASLPKWVGKDGLGTGYGWRMGSRKEKQEAKSQIIKRTLWRK